MSYYNIGSACCFTGHRPDKLPWGTNEDDPDCVALKSRLADTLRAVYDAGIRHFICGMARGSDMYFAEAVIELRNEVPGITLEAAIPCESQFRGWERSFRIRYDYLVHQCDMETLLQRTYTPGCMFLRNKYMVDHSSLLIAVYNGSGGGTRNTIQYAEKRGLEVISLQP